VTGGGARLDEGLVWEPRCQPLPGTNEKSKSRYETGRQDVAENATNEAPGSLVMERKMLRGIKARAERLAADKKKRAHV
jgi:hypothetical protein